MTEVVLKTRYVVQLKNHRDEVCYARKEWCERRWGVSYDQRLASAWESAGSADKAARAFLKSACADVEEIRIAVVVMFERVDRLTPKYVVVAKGASIVDAVAAEGS